MKLKYSIDRWCMIAVGVRSSRRHSVATDDWETIKLGDTLIFSQLGDNIGRVLQDAYVGRNVHK